MLSTNPIPFKLKRSCPEIDELAVTAAARRHPANPEWQSHKMQVIGLFPGFEADVCGGEK